MRCGWCSSISTSTSRSGPRSFRSPGRLLGDARKLGCPCPGSRSARVRRGDHERRGGRRVTARLLGLAPASSPGSVTRRTGGVAERVPDPRRRPPRHRRPKPTAITTARLRHFQSIGGRGRPRGRPRPKAVRRRRLPRSTALRLSIVSATPTISVNNTTTKMGKKKTAKRSAMPVTTTSQPIQRTIPCLNHWSARLSAGPLGFVYRGAPGEGLRARFLARTRRT